MREGCATAGFGSAPSRRACACGSAVASAVSCGTISSAGDRARDAEPTFVGAVSIMARKPALRGVPSQVLTAPPTASPTARNAAAPADAAPLSGAPSAVPGPDEGRLARSPGLRLPANTVCTFPALLSPLLHQTPFAAGAPRFPIVGESSIRVAGLSPPVQAPRCRAGRPGRRARAEASAAARYVPGTGRSQRAIGCLEAEAKAGRGHHWPTARDPAPTAGSGRAERTQHGGCRTRSHSVIPSGPAGCFASPGSVGCPAALGAYGRAGRESEGLAISIAWAGQAAPARLQAQHPGHVVRRPHHLHPWITPRRGLPWFVLGPSALSSVFQGGGSSSWRRGGSFP